MSRIQLLSDEVASQVAAGEVVERPASVVKELVENSLDAGADRIEVRFDRGGVSLIRVVDNGIGMSRDDALLALERHATSKIRSAADLAAVATLGFRGEALPSIASVSRFTLSTREHGAEAGTEVVVSGGKITDVRDGGEAPGTQVEVRSLFFNLPARRKFLRSEATEAGHVEHQMQALALGHPGVAFVLVRDGRIVLQLPATRSLAGRVGGIFGAELLGDLREVDSVAGDIGVRGLIARPGFARSTRSSQFVFVNGRAVENRAIQFGLRDGYRSAWPKGQHPPVFLFLELDPAGVDVNVHPAKREVRFRNHAAVQLAVAEGVAAGLQASRTAGLIPAPATSAPPAPGAPSTPAPAPVPAPAPPNVVHFKLPRPVPGTPELAQSAPAPPAAADAPAPAQGTKSFHILSALGDRYLVMESEPGLVLLDRKAAAERIVFEQMRRQIASSGVRSQRLLVPPVVEVPPKEFGWIKEHIDDLARIGLVLDEFGPGSFKIDAIPAELQHHDPESLVLAFIADLRESAGSAKGSRLGEEKLAEAVSRHAARVSSRAGDDENRQLVDQLLACEMPYCCPRGRPTMIQMSWSELDRKFGRA